MLNATKCEDAKHENAKQIKGSRASLFKEISQLESDLQIYIVAVHARPCVLVVKLRGSIRRKFV